jgi:hypothetical protein
MTPPTKRGVNSPRGLRCAVCLHVVGRTTRWGFVDVNGARGALVLCAQCADDLLATIQRMRAELRSKR